MSDRPWTPRCMGAHPGDHTPFTTDRTYWYVPGARSWHADRGDLSLRYFHAGLCGRTDNVTEGMAASDVRQTELSDRVPSNGHLCGSCARVIAAATDIEDTGDMGNTVPHG